MWDWCFRHRHRFRFLFIKNLTYAPVYYGIRDKKKLEKIVEETTKS